MKRTLVSMFVSGFLLGIFFKGGGAKSIVVQISFVMLLFSDQISGRGKSFQWAAPPPVEESQRLKIKLLLKCNS